MIVLHSFWSIMGEPFLSLGHPFGLGLLFKRNRKEFRKKDPCVFSGPFGRQGVISFRDEVLFIKKVKYFFLYLLWSET